MKKICSFLLVAFLSFSAFCQNKTDDKGKKQGHWVQTNKKGRVEGNFKDGYEEGTFTYYDAKGRMKAVTDFSDKGRRGFTSVFYPSGEKMAEGFYLDKKKDSLWITYTQEGIKLNENFYHKGSKEGIWKVFNGEGKVVEEIRYTNNRKNGLCLQRTHDGNYFYCNYKDDLREGEYKEYWRSGELYITGQYKGDKKDGLWNIYDESQRTIARQTYVNDVNITFEVALFEAEGDTFVDIGAISYFYSKGKQTVVVLNDERVVNVLRDYEYLVELSNGTTFLRLNEKTNFYASSQALKGITPTSDDNYYINLFPEPPFKVITDENSKKAMEYIFLPQEF
ncbi:MAG: hypothetical protein LBO06_08365 [Bacteroidales bacterium]|jgi:antitoxin component YwqK of YwqJK toxin-antitoxin module|nr:hypothetical protein [Bacteroidales bacterium]